MKKISIKMLVFVLFLFIIPIKVFAIDSMVQYFDNIFVSNEFTLNTDVEIDEDSFGSILSAVLSNYNVYESYNSGDYTNLQLSMDSCSYETMTCSFNLYKYVFENNNYTGEFVKKYTDIVINVNSDITYSFSMLDNNNLVVNYDESMFTSEYDRLNYIFYYLNAYNVYDGNISVSYFYQNYPNGIIRVEKNNSTTVSVTLKKLNDVIFDYSEEPYSDDFKKLSNGTLTIKIDSDITTDILSSYLNSFPNFSIDGKVVNNKAFIKMVEYGEDGVIEKEKHLISLVRDSNIDVNLFDKVGYGENVDIPVDTPLDVRNFIMNYFNITSYYVNNDDGSYISYDELFDYNSDSNDYVVIKATKRNNDDVNIQFHKIPIRFIGYSDVYSAKFAEKVGNEIIINADLLSFENINNNIGYDIRALQCNNDFSLCDIALKDYDNNVIEIHKVNISLNGEISSEFMDFFNIKDDKTIDIIVDKNIVFDYGRLYYYYYDDNNNSLNYQCDSMKCKLSLSNYVKNKYETHEFSYNRIESSPTELYSLLVKDSVDIYPGETQNIYRKLSYSPYIFSKDNSSSNIKVVSCDKNVNTCSVIIRNSSKVLEIHNSTVNIKDGKSPEFDTLFPGDKIKINSIYKDDADYIYNASMAFFMSKTKTWSYLNDFSDGKGVVSFNDFESHVMGVEFEKGNAKHKKAVDNVIKKIGNQSLLIELDDLEFINNFYYSDDQNVSTNYNSKKLNDTLSKIINNKHITYFFVEQGGMGNQFMNAFTSKVLLYYDGIAYGISNSSIETIMRKVVYIPSDTDDTPDSYVKAVQDRIDNYFGKNSGVVVSYVGHLEKGEIEDISNNSYLNISNFDGNYYRISYKDKSCDFIIEKDSSKIQNSTFTAIDVNNNVIVSSDNANYPTNTVVASEKFDSSKFKDLLEKLNLADAEIIDINLYSPTLGYISNFDGVSFDVSVPVNLEKFKSKKLYAYYIDNSGNIEEYPITLDDFMAIFKTDHFSTYIISEKINDVVESVNLDDTEEIVLEKNSIQEENLGSNPETFDGVMLWVIYDCICLIGLLYILVSKKEKVS